MNSFNSSSHLSTASLNMSHNSHNSQSHSSTNRFLPSGTGTDSGTYSGSGTRLSYSQRGTNASANNPNNNNNNGDADASQHSNGTGTSHTAQKDTNASSSNRVWRCFGYTVHCNSYNKFRQWCALYCFPICQKILSSLLWRILLVLGNFILLFGSPIHMLWLPKLCDPVMDVLYTLVLLVFMVDMIFRAAVLPGYFGLGVSQIYYARHHHWSYSSIMRWIKMGSFLFCCDLLSTLTLLFDISYIHQERYSITTMEIQLDRVGIPVSYVILYTMSCYILCDVILFVMLSCLLSCLC